MEHRSRAKQRWTQREDESLRALVAAGLFCSQIGAQLGRSEQSVTHRIFTLRISRREERPLTASAVARMFDVSVMVVIRWIRLGWLRARMNGYDEPRKRHYYITLDDTYAFMEKPEHWGRWAPETLNDVDYATREWASELRNADRYLNAEEVAARHFTTVGTVRRWFHDGLLAAVKGNVNHGRAQRLKFSEAEVAAFVPPSMKTREGMAMRRFERDEDLFILARAAGGTPWKQIAREMGRSETSVNAHGRRLIEQAAGVAAHWLHAVDASVRRAG